jgi:hypothetical protein
MARHLTALTDTRMRYGCTVVQICAERMRLRTHAASRRSERWTAIGVSGFCCCWIEQLRRWLSGRLTTNININNSKGHRVPHPGRILNLTLVY